MFSKVTTCTDSAIPYASKTGSRMSKLEKCMECSLACDPHTPFDVWRGVRRKGSVHASRSPLNGDEVAWAPRRFRIGKVSYG